MIGTAEIAASHATPSPRARLSRASVSVVNVRVCGVATSTSKPFHEPVFTSYQDAGLYLGSVAIRIVPFLQITESASVPDVSTDAHAPAPVDPELVPVAALVDELLAHAAAISAKIATR